MSMVQELEKQLEKEIKYNEAFMARLVSFIRKELAKKEVKIQPIPSKEHDNEELDQEVWPSGSSNNKRPSDSPKSSNGSSVPFASGKYMSTRIMCSSTSTTSSRRIWGHLMWLNNIINFLGCSKHTSVPCDDHELCFPSYICMVIMNYVWWMNLMHDV
jgi:hypothetical protein